MTISLGNRAKMSTSTTGTGTITLGSAVSGFQTFADAGITNGQTVRYAIDDGANFEIGSGTYTSSGTTLTRSVTESSNSDSAISLSGNAEVFIAATVADLNPLYAANPSSATNPTASGDNAVAIGNNSTSSGTNSFAFGTLSVASGGTTFAAGYDAVSSGGQSFAFGDDVNATGQFSFCTGGGTATASGTSSIAMGYAAVASNENAVAIGRNTDATHSGSAAIGYDAQAVNAQAIALGDSRAAGSDSFAAVISNNTSSYGATAAGSVAIGKQAKATGNRSLAIGGDTPLASGNNSTAIGTYSKASGLASVALSTELSGYYTESSGTQSVAIGNACIASGAGSFALGERSKSAEGGKYAYASGHFAAIGDAQGGQFVLRQDTTDTTATTLTMNGVTADATNQIIAASDTCITFHGTITAMQNGAQAYGGWEIKGMLVNDGGTTTLALGNVSDMAANNASSWAVALSADDTNNALKIQVTGEAAHNIRWVANVQTAEVTYA